MTLQSEQHSFRWSLQALHRGQTRHSPVRSRGVCRGRATVQARKEAGSELPQVWRKERRRQLADILIRFILGNVTRCLGVVVGKGIIRGDSQVSRFI